MIPYRFVRAARPYYNSQSYSLEVSSYGAYQIYGLLSDTGDSYILGELADWQEDRQMDHVRGAPYHPQTQGKMERWHQILKNRILPEN